MPGRKLIVIILAWIAWSAGTVSAFTELTSDAFMEIYRDTIAPRDSNAFQPMTSELVETSFRTLMDHLWNDNLTGAAGVVKELDSLGYRVGLVQVTDTDIYTIGFMELAHPESPYYQGFGACLFRPDSPGLTLYQSVHPTADLYTEYVSMDAFLTDSDAAALMLAGSHKFANPDANHNGFCDSDTAHEGHNLITVLTRDLLNQWMNGIGPAPWIIQFHGAYDRDTEPDIVASYGRDDLLPGAVELQMVNQCLESVHPHTMGICGYPEPFGSSLED
nr:hypothetical protein [bacterium]